MIVLRHKFPGILLATAFVLLQAACKKDQPDTPLVKAVPPGSPQVAVAEKNQSLLIKFSGTKCDPCGEWGWQAQEEWMALEKGKSAYITAYSQNFVAEGFISATATAMDKHWGIKLWQGYPTFQQNGKIVKAAHDALARQQARAEIDAFATRPVMASAAFTRKWVGGRSMEVKSSVEFFRQGSGAYYVAFYLTEDSAMWAQTGNPQSHDTIPIPHHHVLRDGLGSAQWYGQPLFDGIIQPGVFFDQTLHYDVPSDWDTAHLELTAVIWRMQNNELEFINAFSDQKHP